MALSVMLLDIDHFKGINDCFGHACGDEVLVSMAGVGRINLRAGDIFGRLGGEEFGVILPESDLEMARQISERLRAALAEWRQERNGQEVSITASIGITVLSPEETSLETAFSRGTSPVPGQRPGRNQVVAWEDCLRNFPTCN